MDFTNTEPFHAEFRLLRQLLTRPGHTIREYIRGRRVPHFKPVLMIMILGAVVTVLSKYLLESGGLIPTSLLTINEGARERSPRACIPSAASAAC